MKRLKLAFAIVGMGAVTLSTALAEDPNFSLHDTMGLPKEIILDANLRQRYEHAQWFRPALGDKDNNYGYGDTKAQLGVGYQKDSFKAYFQGQLSSIYGLPSNGSGLGTTYYTQNDSETSSNDVFIRQGYLKYAPANEKIKSSAALGRLLYSSSGESPVEDKSLLWLQQKRVGERLIGPFDFTFGRSFDGGTFSGGNSDYGSLSVSAFRPTNGGFVTDGFDEIQDINVVAAAYSADTKISERPGQAQLFYYYYNDSRDVTKVDNRAIETIAADSQDISINTFGLHWIQLHNFKGQTLDTVLWGALQSGSWGEQNHFAGAAATEAGIKFEKAPWTPWARAGWNWSSGDNSANDNDHNTFFQMLPTARVYAQTPLYNMMNNHDLFVQVLAQPLKNLNLRSDAHVLYLSSSDDLLYSGSGATNGSIFGYSGTPSNGNSYVGTLIDTGAAYNLNKNLTLSAYYGHLFGGGVPESNYVREDIDYLFLEALFKI